LKLFVLCVLSVAAFGALSFSSGSNAYTTTVGGVSTPAGLAMNGGNGYNVALISNGWIVSDNIALDLTTTAATAVTYYTTLKANIGGGVVGVGLAVLSGQGVQTTTCSGFVAAHTSDASLVGKSIAATVCPADFPTVYTSAPGSSLSVLKTAPVLTLNVPIKWDFTPPLASALASTTTGCVAASVTPITTPATTAVTFNAATCGSNAEKDFTVQTQAGSPAAGTTSQTFGWYAELNGVTSGTTAYVQICFQTAAQYAIAPGNCFANILTGALASIGLIAAIFFN